MNAPLSADYRWGSAGCQSFPHQRPFRAKKNFNGLQMGWKWVDPGSPHGLPSLANFERRYDRNEAMARVPVRPAYDGSNCQALRRSLYDGEQSCERV